MILIITHTDNNGYNDINNNNNNNKVNMKSIDNDIINNPY